MPPKLPSVNQDVDIRKRKRRSMSRYMRVHFYEYLEIVRGSPSLYYPLIFLHKIIKGALFLPTTYLNKTKHEEKILY